MREWSHCRLCGGEELESVVDLGVQAISCRYPKTPDEYVPEAPLHLVRCPSCNLGQLTVTLPPEEMYRSGYGYRSGQTDTMKRHLRDLGRTAIDLWGGPEHGVLVDIGSNDATFLRQMPATFQKIGFDPVAADHDYPNGIIKVCERFTANRYFQWMNDRKAAMVFATAMFYDLDDPVEFLGQVESILRSDGILVMEFMYLKAMLDGAWDQISHEHVCYHSLQTVCHAAERAGLGVVGFSDEEINGGTLRVYLQKSEMPIWDGFGGLILDRLAEEASWDWSVIERRIEECRFAAARFVMESDASSLRFIGASQRGNVTLQTILNGNDVSGRFSCIERDERKDGLYTPRTLFQIVHESSRGSFSNSYFVLPWQFKDEILRRERELGAPPGTRYFIPMPVPHVEVL